MAKTNFSGSNEFEKQVHNNFPTIHFSRIQLNEKRKVYMVNPVLGIVVVFNYATQTATYYRISTPKELSAETLGKLFAHYVNTKDTEMESVMREFIYYQKGIAFPEPQAYVDIVELGWGSDLKATCQMLNTHASYDKESENFNRAMAVYRKAKQKGIKSPTRYANAFEFAYAVVKYHCEDEYNALSAELQRMGVPASETFSGEYFDALFARKASAEYAKQVESAAEPNLIVGQMCIIGCDAVPQIINFGLFIF